MYAHFHGRCPYIYYPQIFTIFLNVCVFTYLPLSSSFWHNNCYRSRPACTPLVKCAWLSVIFCYRSRIVKSYAWGHDLFGTLTHDGHDVKSFELTTVSPDRLTHLHLFRLKNSILSELINSGIYCNWHTIDEFHHNIIVYQDRAIQDKWFWQSVIKVLNFQQLTHKSLVFDPKRQQLTNRNDFMFRQ